MAITVTVNRVLPEKNGTQSVRYRADTDSGHVHMSNLILNEGDNPNDFLPKMQAHFDNHFKAFEVRDSIQEYFDGKDIINKAYVYATRPDVTTALVLQAMRSDDMKEVLKIKPIIDWAQANLTEEYMEAALGITHDEYITGMDRFNAITPAMENALNADKRLKI